LKIYKIGKEDARNFLVVYQNLDASQSLSGVDGVLEYMRKVRCIQYDPLNIIGRNTDLVLQSRVIDYKPEMLEQLLYKDRLLIDGWDKMMSVYPVEDWPFFGYTRKQRGLETINMLKHRNSEEALHYTGTILKALSENGPMLPKQIQTASAEAGRWGHRNLSSAAMDYLFHIGKVGVFTKKNVTKVYDLIENLIPGSFLNQANPFISERDFMKWYVYRRIGSVGMLWNKNGGGWLATLMPDKENRQCILDEYVKDDLVQCVEVDGIKERFYIRSKDVGLLEQVNSSRLEVIRFIAPLDNILWERSMLSKVFEFDYTWEVYIPVAKRKYGYYVIPVLYGNRFIARFEPEKSKTQFKIKNWWWEQNVHVSNGIIDLVLQEMERMAVSFNKKDGLHKSTYSILKRARNT